MKKTVLFLSGLFLSWTLSAQTFTNQNSGLNSAISSIDFINDQVGIAVSYEGDIVTTVNGGTNWDAQNSGTINALRDVVMLNTQTAVAVGLDGLILRTSDGGTTWASIPAGTSQNLVCVIYSYSTLYITGSEGQVLKSTDSGLTWTAHTVNVNSNLKTVFFSDANTGYVGGEYGVIYKTVDGGNSWAQLTSGIEVLSGNYQLVGMHFTDSNTGFAVGGNSQTGEGLILKTVNAGASWSVQFLTNNYIGSIDFINSTVGFVAGGSVSSNTSKILKTIDGGNTWNVQSSSSYRQLGAAFPSQNAGYTCGLNGTILKISTISLATNELTDGLAFDVFPNPGTEFFNLVLEEQYITDHTTIEFVNLNGEVIRKQEYHSHIDISDLLSGVYFLKVSNEHFNLTRKVVKE